MIEEFINGLNGLYLERSLYNMNKPQHINGKTKICRQVYHDLIVRSKFCPMLRDEHRPICREERIEIMDEKLGRFIG